MRRGAALALIGAMVLAIGYYAFLSPVGLPDHPLVRGYNDLLLHVVAFLALSLVVLWLWPGVRAVVVLVGLALVVEAGQYAVPRRTPALDDLLAGLAGIGLAVLVIAVLRQRHPRDR